jgi:hypothetical protein
MCVVRVGSWMPCPGPLCYFVMLNYDEDFFQASKTR